MADVIRPSPAQSLATFERVYKATGSIEEAADAVAAAAVSFSCGIFGAPTSERRGALVGLAHDVLPTTVIEVVCSARGVPVALLLTGTRRRYAARARHEIMWILCEEAGIALREVGIALHLADHSSVPYGVEATRERVAHAVGVAEELRGLVERVRVAVAAPASERRAA